MSDRIGNYMETSCSHNHTYPGKRWQHGERLIVYAYPDCSTVLCADRNGRSELA